MKHMVFAAALLAGCAASAGPSNPTASPGAITIDIGSGPDPAGLIVFLPGSGCTPVAKQAAAFFGEMPGHWRIVALEKPGLDGRIRIGCSAAFHAATDYASLIARQSKFAADMLAAYPNTQQKVLVGYSEGGTVAPFVAAATPGFSRLIVAAAGAMPGEMETRLTLSRLFGARAAEQSIAAIKAAPSSQDRFLMGETYRYWSSLFALEPMQAYRDLKLPILMLHGDRDQIVPVDATRYAANEFATAGLKTLTVHYLPGAGHGLYSGDRAARRKMWASVTDWLADAPNAKPVQSGPVEGREAPSE